MASGKFPGPYVADISETDPLVKKIDQDNMDIGARPSGMPKDVKSDGLTISHVGGTAGKGG